MQTQSSLAVSADGERWVLLNASPDLRQQIIATPALHPRRGRRDSPVEAVVVTDGDLDHILGLLLLREGHRFALYGERRLLESLDENPIFRVLPQDRVERRPFAMESEIPLRDREGGDLDLVVKAFAVPGKVALYQEAAAPSLAVEDGSVIGLELAGAGGERLVYIPGCAVITEDLRRRLDGAAALFFDGTLWQDQELIEGGFTAKSGARMGHVSMNGPEGAMERLEDVKIGRRVFLHINNTNPVLLHDAPERRAVETAGWKIAFDGMEVTL